MENKISTRVQNEELEKLGLGKSKNVNDKDSKNAWLNCKIEGCARATIETYIKKVWRIRKYKL